MPNCAGVEREARLNGPGDSIGDRRRIRANGVSDVATPGSLDPAKRVTLTRDCTWLASPRTNKLACDTAWAGHAVVLRRDRKPAVLGTGPVKLR